MNESFFWVKQIHNIQWSGFLQFNCSVIQLSSEQLWSAPHKWSVCMASEVIWTSFIMLRFEAWLPVSILPFIIWKRIIRIFFQNSAFVSYRRKKVIQVWQNMRIDMRNSTLIKLLRDRGLTVANTLFICNIFSKALPITNQKVMKMNWAPHYVSPLSSLNLIRIQ